MTENSLTRRGNRLLYSSPCLGGPLRRAVEALDCEAIEPVSEPGDRVETEELIAGLEKRLQFLQEHPDQGDLP
jgi:hypothetical protein